MYLSAFCFSLTSNLIPLRVFLALPCLAYQYLNLTSLISFFNMFCRISLSVISAVDAYSGTCINVSNLPIQVYRESQHLSSMLQCPKLPLRVQTCSGLLLLACFLTACLIRSSYNTCYCLHFSCHSLCCLRCSSVQLVNHVNHLHYHLSLSWCDLRVMCCNETNCLMKLFSYQNNSISNFLHSVPLFFFLQFFQLFYHLGLLYSLLCCLSCWQ